MQIVIEIDEDIYKDWKREGKYASRSYAQRIILDGKPLPKGHGKLKDINVIRQKLMIWDYKVNAIPNYAWKCIEEAPIIIEADGGGEDGVSD